MSSEELGHQDANNADNACRVGYFWGGDRERILRLNALSLSATPSTVKMQRRVGAPVCALRKHDDKIVPMQSSGTAADQNAGCAVHEV
jgi:hypothetical protein